MKPNIVQACKGIWLILCNSALRWVVLGKFGLFYDLYYSWFISYHLKLTTVPFENDMPRISAAIWHWKHCHAALPYTNNRGRWQNLKQKKASVGRKKKKNISLFLFNVNVNVLKRTSLQALWNILQSLKHWRRVVLSSVNIRNDFWNSYGESQSFYSIILSNET